MKYKPADAFRKDIFRRQQTQDKKRLRLEIEKIPRLYQDALFFK